MFIIMGMVCVVVCWVRPVHTWLEDYYQVLPRSRLMKWLLYHSYVYIWPPVWFPAVAYQSVCLCVRECVCVLCVLGVCVLCVCVCVLCVIFFYVCTIARARVCVCLCVCVFVCLYRCVCNACAWVLYVIVHMSGLFVCVPFFVFVWICSVMVVSFTSHRQFNLASFCVIKIMPCSFKLIFFTCSEVEFSLMNCNFCHSSDSKYQLLKKSFTFINLQQLNLSQTE